MKPLLMLFVIFFGQAFAFVIIGIALAHNFPTLLWTP